MASHASGPGRWAPRQPAPSAAGGRSGTMPGDLTQQCGQGRRGDLPPGAGPGYRPCLGAPAAATSPGATALQLGGLSSGPYALDLTTEASHLDLSGPSVVNALRWRHSGALTMAADATITAVSYTHLTLPTNREV